MNAQAITGHERTLPAGQMLVSKTDTAGKFTYANEAYGAVSGHDPAAMIGLTHGINRHPQVPNWVFEDMWRQLGKGKPWRGVLLNRCSNGDHYWVDAFITPIRKNGVTVEYLSVQLEASAEQIANAEAAFKLGKAPLRNQLSPRRFLSIKRGVLTGVIFVFIATLVTLAISMATLNRSATSFERVHTDAEVLAQVAQTDRFAAIAQNQLFVALRHAPHNASIVAKDNVDIDEHLAEVRKAQAEMNRSGEALAQRINRQGIKSSLGNDEQIKLNGLLQNYVDALGVYSGHGLASAIKLIEGGKFAEGEALVLGDIGSMVTHLQTHSVSLGQQIELSANIHQGQMSDLLVQAPRVMSFWVLFVIVVVVGSGVWFFRDTMGPLREAIRAMHRIAEGDLNERLDVYGYGEPGELVSTLSIMQIRLKVMLDEIRQASANVHAQIGKLNQSIITVLNNTEDAHGQVSQIIQTLSENGSDTARLAASSAVALQLAQALAQPDAPDSALLSATREAATLADLNEFAASEIARMSNNIVGYLGESRESVNGAWSAGVNLESTSQALNEMLAKFE